ncbi:uncharacterized protein LOC124953453 isoform X2 [Vespa velutina]|uniref:uncharacterized protein LOC124953453 isoform X2 n=1 Tax=Vespa velutina TaxID=202808 RepID=UPI001FB56753|nr:uncharacterized protein LOC124953453 isoform X2 [Vespa velutina]XP_047360819.1 uncharacterized protein LOC124953453 isoform X2 [Vespa velutina]
MGLRPYQSSNDLFVQFYQLAFSKVPLVTTIKVLQYVFAAICFLYTYSNYYLKYVQMKAIVSHIKFDYEHMSSKYDFDITERYIKESKLYTFSIIGMDVECYTEVRIRNTTIKFLLKIGHPFRESQKFNQIWNEYNWIVDVIKHHERIMEYVDFLNCSSKRIYLIEISFIMLFIILDFLFIFQVSSVRENITQIIECSSYIACSIFVTFVNFYIGQTLINHSVEARDELCKIPFYNLSIRVQKLLLFMLMRWSKPCVLSIGDVFVSSHKAFAGQEA